MPMLKTPTIEDKILRVEYDCKVIQVGGQPFKEPIGLKVYYGHEDVTGSKDLKLSVYERLNDAPLRTNYMPWFSDESVKTFYFSYTYNGVESYKIPNICYKSYNLSPIIGYVTSVSESVPVLNKKEKDLLEVDSFGFVFNIGINGNTLSLGESRRDYFRYKLGSREEIIKEKVTLTTDDDGTFLQAQVYLGEDRINFSPIALINVSSLTLSSISINSLPKIVYHKGDKFDSQGLSIKLHYSGTDYTEIVSSGMTYSHVVNSASANLVDGVTAIEGDDTVIVTYSGTTTSYNIYFELPNIIDIKPYNYNNRPAIGSIFNPNSVYVGITYSDGQTFVCNHDSMGINTDQTDVLDSTLTINENNEITNSSYGQKVYHIQVLDVLRTEANNENVWVDCYIPFFLAPNASITKIEVERDLSYDGNPYEYIVGERFTAKGLKVYATYNDQDVTRIEIPEYRCNPQIGDAFSSYGKKTVYFYVEQNGAQTGDEVEIQVRVPYKDVVSNAKNYKIDFSVESVKVVSEEGFEDIVYFGPEYKQTNYASEKLIKNGNHYYKEGNIFVKATEFDGNKIYYIKASEKRPLFLESQISNASGKNTYIGTNANSDCVGYIEFGFIDEFNAVQKTARVVFFSNLPNPTQNDSNVEVLFPCHTKGYSDKIAKCRFGIVFNNRLFVSGNPDFKNVDWHTSPEGDLTYFSDLDYCEYGTVDTAVVGYDIYKDGTLSVFKESSRTEATIYTRNFSLINATSYDGTAADGLDGNYLKEEAFACFPVNTNGGVGAVNSKAIVNYLGETVFATYDDLKILGSKETTYNNAKYTIDTSSEIKNAIKNEHLEESFMFAFKNDLYLATSEKVYVKQQTVRSNEIVYSWYCLEGLKPSVMFELDNVLCFADAKGNLYRQLKDYKYDIDRYYMPSATAWINSNNSNMPENEDEDYIVLNNNYYGLLSDDGNCSVMLVPVTNSDNSFEKALFISLGTFTPNQNNRFNYVAENYNLIGSVVYVDNITSSDYAEVKLNVRKPYILSMDDDGYYLEDLVTNNEVSLEAVDSFRLCKIVDKNDTFVVSEVEQSFVVLKYKDNIANFIQYDNINAHVAYRAIVSKKKPIKAYWLTKPFDLGTFTRYKTIYSWSVINDSNIASKVIIGYLASRNSSEKIVINSGSKQIDLTGWLFSKTQIGSDKLPKVYSKVRILPAISFIRFRFENEPGENMALTKIAIYYSVGQIIKGVR